MFKFIMRIFQRLLHLLLFVDVGLFAYGWHHGATFVELAEMLWDSDTQALFASIIAFHFGGRAFGK